MKTFNSILYSFAAIALCAAAAVSCNTDKADYPDRFALTDGNPVVYSIRYAETDENITQAYMDEVICLLGENLTSIAQLWFNDQKAILNTSYITNNTLLVAVPKNWPAVKTDMIYMINAKNDTTTFDFKVLPPAPVAKRMSNEWAAAGESVTIYGDYFIDDPESPLQIEFPNAVVPHSDMTFDGTSAVSFHVPVGATAGYVNVTSVSGMGRSYFQYRDERGLLFDFDGKTGLGNHGWHAQVIESDETSIDGNFLRLGDPGVTMDADGAWNDGNFSFEYWPGNWNTPESFDSPDGLLLTDLADFSDFANMSYKFEMFIPSSNPWSAGAMQIIPAGIDVVTLQNANNTYISGDGAEPVARALYMPWRDTGSFDTGDKWITVTIPLTDIRYKPDGTAATTSVNKDTFTSLVIFVCSGGVKGTDCQPVIKIDNIRAVPNK